MQDILLTPPWLVLAAHRNLTACTFCHLCFKHNQIWNPTDGHCTFLLQWQFEDIPPSLFLFWSAAFALTFEISAPSSRSARKYRPRCHCFAKGRKKTIFGTKPTRQGPHLAGQEESLTISTTSTSASIRRWYRKMARSFFIWMLLSSIWATVKIRILHFRQTYRGKNFYLLKNIQSSLQSSMNLVKPSLYTRVT